MLLSIIIPVYNGAAFIKKTVEKIICFNDVLAEQFEIILINDGSSDNSKIICEELARSHSCVLCVNQTNGGIAAARNTGLNYANGDYISFFDQDDTPVKGYHSFIDALLEENVDFLISNPTIDDNNKLYIREITKRKEIISNDKKTDLARILMAGNDVPLINKKNKDITLTSSVWNCIFRKQFLEDNTIHFQKYVDFEDDWMFILDCLTAAKNVLLLPDTFYCWKIREGSESHRTKYIDDFYHKRCNVIHWILHKCEELGLDDKETAHFKMILSKRTILWGFYNACWKAETSVKEIKKEIKNIVEAEKNKYPDMKYYPEGKKEKILLNLLLNRLYRTAILLNLCVFKMKYH